MLDLDFFGQIVHFAINLFAFLVFFAIFWLYFDSWVNKHEKKEVVKSLGALAIAFSFLVNATVVEQSVLGHTFLGNSNQDISTILRLIGYGLLITGQLIEPLIKKPDLNSLKPQTTPAIIAGSKTFGLVFALPLGAFTVAALYWRRATTGLEKHLKPVAKAFFVLALYEIVSLSNLLINTSNPQIYSWVKAFGPLWIIANTLLLVACLILILWVWRYLLVRFMSQLFMIFTSMIMVIYLITTVAFTFLLLRSIQTQSLDNLNTAANVLNYALDSKKAETLANAQVIAQNPKIAAAVTAKDHRQLVALTSNFLATKKVSKLIVTSDSAQVFLRADDPSRWGDSLSNDSLIRRSLIGESTSGLTVSQGVIAPSIYINSAVPIRDSDNKIVGVVEVGVPTNDAFVSGIKQSTGLDSSVYAGNVRSATTFLSPDGKSNLVGVKETNKTVNDTVIKNGQVFKGQLGILNQQYLAVYQPLKDANNTVIGMLFIGKPQSLIVKTAAHSIQLTFLISTVLLVLSIIPSYLLAKHLSRELE